MKKVIILFLLLGAAVPACFAADEAASVEDAVKAKFLDQYPKISVDAVSKAPIDGLYEIVAGDRVIYYDPAGGYVITGAIWDNEGVNLTEKKAKQVAEARAQANYSMLNAALEKAVKVGSGKNVVIEITDPDCPYCRTMHNYWQSRADVTRYIFLMPIAALHPNAEAKSRYILASADRVKALDEVFSGKFDSTPPEAGDDKGLFGAHRDLIESTGINGTPAFYINGTFVHGANVPEIEKIIGATTPEEIKAPDNQPAK